MRVTVIGETLAACYGHGGHAGGLVDRNRARALSVIIVGVAAREYRTRLISTRVSWRRCARSVTRRRHPRVIQGRATAHWRATHAGHGHRRSMWIAVIGERSTGYSHYRRGPVDRKVGTDVRDDVIVQRASGCAKGCSDMIRAASDIFSCDATVRRRHIIGGHKITA